MWTSWSPSVAELGFESGARYDKICAQALKMGLELCPAEVGPALSLAYGDQPKDEWLRIAMEAIIACGDLNIFAVVHDDELCLCGNYGDADGFSYADIRFVFVRRK